MIARVIVLLAAAALAGCAVPANEAGPGESSESSTPPLPDPRAPASLVGEWRVAGIDGSAITGDVGLTLSIDDETIVFPPRCAGYVWAYRYAHGALTLARATAPDPPVKRFPPPVCAIALSSQLGGLATALDHATHAVRTPENGVLLAGGGHSVLLFSQ